MWLVDVLLDVFIFGGGESFVESLIPEKTTEIWMRTLVIIVFCVSSVVIQHFMRKQRKSELALIQHQHNLEKIIDQRTQALQRLANFDILTGIYNRRMFSHCFEKERMRAIRDKQPLSLILCDVDHFKLVNDQYGHNEGDRVLKLIADIFREHMRLSDIYARWGGEEFILLLPNTALTEARVVAEKLREKIGLILYGENHATTASFGVSELHEDELSQPIIQRADKALYDAKHGGRNCVRMIA